MGETPIKSVYKKLSASLSNNYPSCSSAGMIGSSMVIIDEGLVTPNTWLNTALLPEFLHSANARYRNCVSRIPLSMIVGYPEEFDQSRDTMIMDDLPWNVSKSCRFIDFIHGVDPDLDGLVGYADNEFSSYVKLGTAMYPILGETNINISVDNGLVPGSYDILTAEVCIEFLNLSINYDLFNERDKGLLDKVFGEKWMFFKNNYFNLENGWIPRDSVVVNIFTRDSTVTVTKANSRKKAKGTERAETEIAEHQLDEVERI